MRERKGRERERLSNLPSESELGDGRAKIGPNSSESGLISLPPACAHSGKLCRFTESVYSCSFLPCSVSIVLNPLWILSSLLVHLSYYKYLNVLGALAVALLGRLLEKALLQLQDQRQPAHSPFEHLTLGLIKSQGDN